MWPEIGTMIDRLFQDTGVFWYNRNIFITADHLDLETLNKANNTKDNSKEFHETTCERGYP